MANEPKRQEPEIPSPVPEVEPDRGVPEIPPDKDAPEKKGPIQAETVRGNYERGWEHSFHSMSPMPVRHLYLEHLEALRVGCSSQQKDGSFDMDREHIKGAADKAKGAIKDTAGKLTGDKELQSEGKLDKAKGDVHNAVGNVKDAARDLTK